MSVAFEREGEGVFEMSLAERNRGLDTPDKEAVDCVFHRCIRTISQGRSRVVSAFEPELSEREPRREAARPRDHREQWMINEPIISAQRLLSALEPSDVRLDVTRADRIRGAE